MNFPNQDYLSMFKNKQQQQQQQPYQQQFCYPMMTPQSWNYWVMQQQFQQMSQMQMSPLLAQQQVMSPTSPLSASIIPPQSLSQPQQNLSKLQGSQSQPTQNKHYVEVNGTIVKMNMKMIKDEDDMLDYDEIKREKQKKKKFTNKSK